MLDTHEFSSEFLHLEGKNRHASYIKDAETFRSMQKSRLLASPFLCGILCRFAKLLVRVGKRMLEKYTLEPPQTQTDQTAPNYTA